MAEVIDSRIESRKVYPRYSILLCLSVGLFVGIIYWLLSFAINRYSDSLTIASGIAGILSATLGTFMMVGLKMTRPLLVAVAATLSLWNISAIVHSLSWIEALVWISFIYSLAYLVFSWIARYLMILPVIIITLFVIILLRVSISI